MTPTDSLPERLLLVASSPVEGAALAAGFLDVQLVSPEELADALRGDSFPCVAIADVGVEGALAGVVRDVLAHACEDVTVLLEASERSGLPGVRQDPDALAGLALKGIEVVAGLPCLVLHREHEAAAPDVGLLVDYLSLVVAARVTEASGASSGEAAPPDLVQPGEVLAAAQEYLAEAEARNATLVQRLRRAYARRFGRLRHAAVLVGAVVALLLGQAAVAVFVARVTEENVAAALGTALLLPVLAGLLYVMRGQRRFARLLGKVAKDLKRGRAEHSKLTAAVQRSVDEQATRLEALARKLEVVEVTAVDSARSLAALAHDLHEPRGGVGSEPLCDHAGDPLAGLAVPQRRDPPRGGAAGS